MKNKNIFAGLLALAMFNGTAFAEIFVQNGRLDREFTTNRTLYYVEYEGDEIPDITADGYELIKKAESPYMGGALLSENTTIIKNTETGIRYRFVFEKKGGSVDVTSIDLTSGGMLTIKGSVNGLNDIEILILKPTEDFGEKAFEGKDIEGPAMEKTVLDAIEVKSEDISGDLILEYQFPVSAVSGQYGFLITGEGVDENYYSTKFYMSETDIQNVISEINEKSVFNDVNTLENLKTYVEENAKRLYFDMTKYNELSDDAKAFAVSALESEGDYTTLDEIGEKFNRGVTIAWLYDGLAPEEILEGNEILNFEMYENYLDLKDKDGVKKAIKGLKTEEEIRTAFNKKVAISMLNEAEPSEIKTIIEKYNDYIGIEESLYNYFIKNSSKCIKALGNKGFDDENDINNAIKKVKNSGSGGGGNGGGGGGIPSGGINSSVPQSTGGYIAPITEQKPVVSEPPKEEVKVENKLPFEDIDGVEWAYTAIEHLYNNKVLNGKSEKIFAPNDNVKREEFVKLVVNGFGLEKDGETKFADVDKDAWYAEFLNIAFNSGVVNGVSETEFGVGKYITREDMAVMIYRAVKASGMDVEIIVENPAELSDMDSVSDYAKEAVEFMIEKGAINGINGEFRPKDYATRAQTAQMLYQIIKIR